jgi:hypothetical protein
MEDTVQSQTVFVLVAIALQENTQSRLTCIPWKRHPFARAGSDYDWWKQEDKTWRMDPMYKYARDEKPDDRESKLKRSRPINIVTLDIVVLVPIRHSYHREGIPSVDRIGRIVAVAGVAVAGEIAESAAAIEKLVGSGAGWMAMGVVVVVAAAAFVASSFAVDQMAREVPQKGRAFRPHTVKVVFRQTVMEILPHSQKARVTPPAAAKGRGLSAVAGAAVAVVAGSNAAERTLVVIRTRGCLSWMVVGGKDSPSMRWS